MRLLNKLFKIFYPGAVCCGKINANSHDNLYKIAVGLSGGIDSAVTAAILRNEGHEVQAVTMQFWSGRIKLKAAGPPAKMDNWRSADNISDFSANLSHACPAQAGVAAERSNRNAACFGPGEAEDIEAAREVAAYLGIPHTVIPLAEEYEEKVLGYYRREYLAGRTPNPCVVCNALIKFGALFPTLEKAGLDCDLLAMGHYARIEHDSAAGLFRLRQGTDNSKDQSYFLHRLNQQQFAKIILPLGSRLKKDVITLAREWKLPRVLDKPESQDFLESGDHACLFDKNLVQPGPIVDLNGKKIGMHRGLVYYTIGQREGLGISAGQRLYVKEIRAGDNAIVVAERDEVLTSQTAVKDINWICGTPPAKEFTSLVRLRYRHAGAQAVVTLSDEKDAQLAFNEPQFAVTPGQAAVFYRGDEVLGGGWIS